MLTKASKAEKETDITETKEQIKLELMGNLDDQKTNYTNSDVIAAVNKITDKTVEVEAPKVESKKGNDVDISDLWVSEKTIKFKIEYKFGGNSNSVTRNFIANERKDLV